MKVGAVFHGGRVPDGSETGAGEGSAWRVRESDFEHIKDGGCLVSEVVHSR